ncbi:MAG TPA: HesA/MoeB/ThiF family protein [Polyangia bacterium]|nr:HesA/MoeB/ThiF family protein [Polyangia bacterium]
MRSPRSTVRVLVVGAGGLGCPALWELAPLLAARGGSVTIADDDVVEASNLQRQILHRDADVGRPKVDSAADALDRRWPRLAVYTVEARVAAHNVGALVAAHDVVLDGTDSFESKFLLNDACVRAGVPLVHGAVVRFGGQLMTVTSESACYRCLFEAPPEPGAAPSCQEAGVLGAVCGVVGALMAREALAILDGTPQLAGALMIYDALALPDRARRRVAIRRRLSCEACARAAAALSASIARSSTASLTSASSSTATSPSPSTTTSSSTVASSPASPLPAAGAGRRSSEVPSC